MDHVTELMDAELIDLGAVSVETQGNTSGLAEPEGRFIGLGIAED